MSRESFRPLAGISCVVRVLGRRRALPGFRPLAGISCVARRPEAGPVVRVSVPSRG